MDIRDFFEFEDAINEFFYFLFLEENKEKTLAELLNLLSVLSQIEPKYENSYKFLSSNILNLKKQTFTDIKLSKKFLKLSNIAKKYFEKRTASKYILKELKREKKDFENFLKNNILLSSKLKNNKLLTLAYLYLKDNLEVITKIFKV